MYTNTQVPSAQEVFLLSFYFTFWRKSKNINKPGAITMMAVKFFVLVLSEWKKQNRKEKKNNNNNTKKNIASEKRVRIKVNVIDKIKYVWVFFNALHSSFSISFRVSFSLCAKKKKKSKIMFQCRRWFSSFKSTEIFSLYSDWGKLLIEETYCMKIGL